MEKHSLIEGLKALERQILERIDKIDASRRKLLQVIEDGLQNREHLKDISDTLYEDLFHLRDTYQQVIYKVALLTNAEDRNK